MRGFSDTHIDQSEVVFIDWELLWADVFLQSRGIGALKDKTQDMKTWGCFCYQLFNTIITLIIQFIWKVTRPEWKPDLFNVVYVHTAKNM